MHNIMANDFNSDELKAAATNAFSHRTFVPPSDWASPYVSFNNDNPRSDEHCCFLCGASSCNHSTVFADKFQILKPAAWQKQPLSLKSIFTDRVNPTLNFSPQLVNSNVRCQPDFASKTRPLPGSFDAEVDVCIAKSASFARNEFVDLDSRRTEAESESGWTMYLDQSAEWNAQQSQSALKRLRPSSALPSLKRSNADDEENYAGTLIEECQEDPSMASDASSGPEQPEFVRREHCKRNAFSKMRKTVAQVLHCHRQEDDLDDTCQSNLSCESVSDDPRSDGRQFKRRKVVDQALDRAASEIGDGHSGENDVEIEAGEAEICSYPAVVEHVYKNAVDSRLEVLQHLIPNSRELDEEEVLEVAIDYVKSLEEKIKMFEAAGISNSLPEGSVESNTTSQTSAGASALQDKGLCLMPIAMVATNLEQVAGTGVQVSSP